MRKSVIVKCGYCNKDIEKKPYKLKRHKNLFCNPECQRKYRIGKAIQFDRKPIQILELICENCSKKFEKRKSSTRGKRFCSLECYWGWSTGENCNNWRGGKIKSKCINCNKIIYRHKNRIENCRHNFCDSKCHHEWRTGENHHFWKGGISAEPYCQVWMDKEYKKDIKERDRWQCMNPCCLNNSIRLMVHHINYDKKDCSPQNLISICNSCNTIANHNREWHKSWYQAIMHKRYGHIY
jgi:hypothetical protein